MTKRFVVEVDKISKNFGPVQALDELELKVEPGLFGIIGPNGAGKTTLLRILLGLIQPSSGSARVLDMDISQSKKIRERIGVLLENPTLPKAMSAREYLSQVIKLYGGNSDPDELLELVGLQDAINRQIGHLSAGMRQRLGIALAFAGNPDLIILDEPTSNLDVPGREQMLDLLSHLYHKSKVSIIIASHILSELEQVCTHVAFMNRGKNVVQGTTNDIIEKYALNRFRIRCSDAHTLAQLLDGKFGIEDIRLLGPNMFSFRYEESIDSIVLPVRQEAESCNIQIHRIEIIASLEDAFREVIQ
jgi:ABC-2 type transport system ATP-binding protein